MKSVKFYLPFLLVWGLCLQLGAQNNYLLPDKLLVRTYISEQNSSIYTTNMSYQTKIAYHQQTVFPEYLVNEILDRNLTVFDPIGTENLYNPQLVPLSDKDFRENLGEMEQEIVVENIETGEFGEVLRTIERQPEELKGFILIDSWEFDTLNLNLQKQVQQVCPVRYFYRDDDFDMEYVLQKNVGCLVVEQKSEKQINQLKKKSLHVATVTYEQLLYNEFELKNPMFYSDDFSGLAVQNQHAPILAGIARERLVKSIINSVLKGQIVAYNFETDAVIGREIILKHLDAEADTLVVEDLETGVLRERILDREPRFEEIKALIFTEEWYFEPESFYLIKEVKKIAPVRYYLSEDDKPTDELRRTVVFEIKQN